MSVRKGNDVLAGSAPIKIDSALNANSANPVQNSVITTAINNINSSIVDINTTLDNKQDTISAGSGITITDNTVAVSNLDCGTMS